MDFKSRRQMASLFCVNRPIARLSGGYTYVGVVFYKCVAFSSKFNELTKNQYGCKLNTSVEKNGR